MLGCAGGCRGAFFHWAKPNVLNKSGMTKLRVLIMSLIVPRIAPNLRIVPNCEKPPTRRNGGNGGRRDWSLRSSRVCHPAPAILRFLGSSVFVVWQRNMERRLRAGLHFGETTRPYSEARPTRSK